MEERIIKALEQSNLIEGVDSEDALLRARYAWDYVIKEKELTPSIIRKTHKLLMIGQPIFDFHRGYFRRDPVWIGGKEAKPWHAVPILVERWCEEANKSSDLIKAKLDHVNYEKIHPFIDGNGRTGRIFMNWQLVKNGLEPVIIWNDTKHEEYYKWFVD